MQRARDILHKHEVSEHQLSERLSQVNTGAAPGNGSGEQHVLFTPIDQEALDALRSADLDQLRPLDALNLLAELKKQIS